MQLDSIDVWGMPLAADLFNEERVAKCKAHVLDEIASQDAAENDGFPITRLDIDVQWQRAIIIIDRPQKLWDEGEGGFLVLS